MSNPEHRAGARPLISVVIPAHDSAHLLGACLDAVLAQTYSPTEVIVVDDGSGDDTAALCRRYPVRYIHQPHQGASGARNTGVVAAAGRLIAFIDADDLWEPDKLTWQACALDAAPDAGGAIALMSYFLEPGLTRPPSLRPELLDAPQVGYVPSALLLRRVAFDTVGPFDPAFEPAEDSDWFFRAKDAGLVLVTVPRVLVHKRVHGANVSLHAAAVRRALLTMTRASIARMRGTRGGDAGGEP